MTLYALHLPKRDRERISLLASACKKLGVAFCPVDPYSFDFSSPPPIKEGDMLYRVSRGKILYALEDFFLRKGVKTFYKDSFFKRKDPFVMSKNTIPSPRAIFCVTRNRSRLKDYAKKLGGFPIVIKALGGTRGLGVMKIDSASALFSTVDYLFSQNKLLMLCEYIPVKASARFVVLGNKVIASYEYEALGDDFRTNQSKHPRVCKKIYPKIFEKLAVRATHAMGLLFGGVDMLIWKYKPYITEVNFPNNFVRAQKLLKQDIALQMVKYLS